MDNNINFELDIHGYRHLFSTNNITFRKNDIRLINQLKDKNVVKYLLTSVSCPKCNKLYKKDGICYKKHIEQCQNIIKNNKAYIQTPYKLIQSFK